MFVACRFPSCYDTPGRVQDEATVKLHFLARENMYRGKCSICGTMHEAKATKEKKEKKKGEEGDDPEEKSTA